MENRITNDDSGGTFKWLMKWMPQIKWLYIFSSVFTILSASCFVFFSWYLANFAATWLVDKQIIAQNLLYAIAFFIGRYIFAHLASLINYQSGAKVVSAIKTKLYPRLLNQNETDSVSSTLLVTRVCDDLKPFYSFFIPYAVASALVALLLLSISFWVEFWVGLSLTISILVIPLLMMIIGVGASSLHKKHINLFMRYSAVFYNRLHTIAEIVNLDNLKSQYQFLSKKSKAVNNATIDVMKIAILSSAVLELFVSIAIAAVAIFLGMSLLGIIPGSNYGKGYDFRDALFLLTLAPYLFFYLRKFVSSYHDKNRALASAKLLMPLLDKVEETPMSIGDEIFKTLNIKELTFAYPNTMIKVLHNIHLELPDKGLVLIKGISGSGKSTLLKILSGNLPMQDGIISVNEHDKAWSLQWLKENTSYMNQFPFIFDGTLKYNVFLEKATETHNEYPDFLNKLLAKKAEGWETLLSHNGKQFSGGEKQLITLARMILHPKPIAILDEPTANLDADTIKIVLEQILKISESKLVILASHDESFEAVANKVLALNWGEQMNEAKS